MITGSSVGLVVAVEVEGLTDDVDVAVDGLTVLVDGDTVDVEGLALQEMGKDPVGKHVIDSCASASPSVFPTPATCQIANTQNPRTAMSARRGANRDTERSSLSITGPYPPLKPSTPPADNDD